MTRTTTAASLRRLFPRGFGANGIADLAAADYIYAARELVGEDRRRFYALAAKRHQDTADRAVADGERHYRGGFGSGRMGGSVTRRHAANVALAGELRTIAEHLGRQADRVALAEAEAADAAAAERALETPARGSITRTGTRYVVAGLVGQYRTRAAAEAAAARLVAADTPPPAAGGSPELEAGVDLAGLTAELEAGLEAARARAAEVHELAAQRARAELARRGVPPIAGGSPALAADGMLYLSGAINRAAAAEAGVGFLFTPNTGNRTPAGALWAADNGCYTRPETYSDERFLAWLEARIEQAGTLPLFAVAADVVGDAAATLERSAPMLEAIRALGVPAALVAQDGLEALEVPWSTFDWLFIGGSTEWKESDAALELVAEAKRRGKMVHAGRVNSGRRMALFCEAGADTADGTFLAFGPAKNLPRLRAWLAASRERRAARRLERELAAAELARRGVPVFAGAGPELDTPAVGFTVELERRGGAIGVLPVPATLTLEQARGRARQRLRLEAGVRAATVLRPDGSPAYRYRRGPRGTITGRALEAPASTPRFSAADREAIERSRQAIERGLGWRPPAAGGGPELEPAQAARRLREQARAMLAEAERLDPTPAALLAELEVMAARAAELGLVLDREAALAELRGAALRRAAATADRLERLETRIRLAQAGGHARGASPAMLEQRDRLAAELELARRGLPPIAGGGPELDGPGELSSRVVALRAALPAAPGGSIATLTLLDYVHAASAAGLEPLDRARLYRVGAERHRAAADRAEAQRFASARAGSTRKRHAVARGIAANRELADELVAAIAELARAEAGSAAAIAELERRGVPPIAGAGPELDGPAPLAERRIEVAGEPVLVSLLYMHLGPPERQARRPLWYARQPHRLGGYANAELARALEAATVRPSGSPACARAAEALAARTGRPAVLPRPSAAI